MFMIIAFHKVIVFLLFDSISCHAQSLCLIFLYLYCTLFSLASFLLQQQYFLLFLDLRAITKSKVKLIVIVFKNKKKQQPLLLLFVVGRAITIERAIKKRNRKLIPKMKQRRLRVIRSNRENCNISIEKIEIL